MNIANRKNEYRNGKYKIKTKQKIANGIWGPMSYLDGLCCTANKTNWFICFISTLWTIEKLQYFLKCSFFLTFFSITKFENRILPKALS